MYTAAGNLEQDTVIEEYLPLVRRQALALRVSLPSYVEFDDLLQAGYLGLMDALARFDESQGTPFAGYAVQRIRGAMIDELRTRDWLPRSVRRKARAMDLTIRKLEQTLGRNPTEQEIASNMGMDLEEYRNLLSDANNGLLLPLEQMCDEGWEPSSNANIEDTIFSNAVFFEQRDALVRAIEQLPDREKTMMALYYQEELNLKEIGEILGVGESRVCQMHSQAISRIRTKFRAEAILE